MGDWIGFGLYQFWRNMGKVSICVCVLVAVVCVVLGKSGWAACARVWEGIVVLCLCVCCESGFSVLMAGPGICILC